MELSERYIQQLESEGFAHVSEDIDPPGTAGSSHSHEGRVTLWITDGEVKFIIGDEEKNYSAGDRIDILPHTAYSYVVGERQLIYIVAEEIAGDA